MLGEISDSGFEAREIQDERGVCYPTNQQRSYGKLLGLSQKELENNLYPSTSLRME